MTDQLSLRELAGHLGCEFRGDPETTVTGVSTLQQAGDSDLSFLANPRYRKHLAQTRAGIVVLRADDAEGYDGAALLCDDPYASYARAAALFDHARRFEPGIHPGAFVDPAARLADGCFVGAGTVVESGAEIGSGVHLGHGTIIGRNCSIGDNSFLGPRVTVTAGARLGQRVIVHPGAVIGADGFGLAFHEGGWIKVPQLGSVVIGDDCEIGANTTIDRGALEDTVLENDVRLDNQIQIAHNVHIGAHTAMAGCSAVAGSARIGKYCLIGGGAGILGHLEVADRVTVTAMSLVTRSITEAGEYSSGTPLQPNRDWRRNAVRLRQLDDMARRLRRLEKE